MGLIEAGWTQQAVANRFGVTTRAVRKWLTKRGVERPLQISQVVEESHRAQVPSQQHPPCTLRREDSLGKDVGSDISTRWIDHQPIPAKGIKKGAPTIYPLSGGKVHGQATPQLKTFEPSSRKSQLGWPKETTLDRLGKDKADSASTNQLQGRGK